MGEDYFGLILVGEKCIRTTAIRTKVEARCRSLSCHWNIIAFFSFSGTEPLLCMVAKFDLT
jgi:hypothetical protein